MFFKFAPTIDRQWENLSRAILCMNETKHVSKENYFNQVTNAKQ